MMKSIYLFLFLTVSFVAFSQEMENIQLRWEGDTSDFLINDSMVSLSAEGSGSSEIQSAIKNYYGFESSFQFSLDFSPSSSNRVSIYIANNREFSDGVALELGESGSNDQWILRELRNGEEVKSQRGEEIFASSFTDLEIRLKKEVNSWTAFIGEDSLTMVSAFIQDSLYFGLSCNYTSSNAGGFHLYNYAGAETLKDFDPPRLDTLFWLNSDSVRLVFDESVKMDQETFSTEKTLHKSMLNSYNQLFTLNIEITDRNENKIFIDTSFYSKQMRFQSCAFNELMIDPSPSLGVYEEEYIELINLSGRDLFKTEFYLVYNQDTSLISIDEWKKDSLMVIYDQSLSNEKFILELLDPYGSLIDHFEYNHSLFSNKQRSGGGWSLEKKDSDYFGDYFNTWEFHQSFRGGSPGVLNEKEVLFDNERPYIVWLELNGTDTLYHFNEPVYYDNRISTTFEVVDDIQDLSTNRMNDTILVLDNIQEVGSKNVMISEILFRPSAEIPEFIELVNHSDKAILLDGLWLAKESNNEVLPIYQFPEKLVQPNEYFTICKDKYLLRKHEYLNKMTILDDLDFPDLLSSEMHLLLITQNEEVIDEIQYNVDWTPNDLNLTEGYSFERVGENGLISESWKVASFTSNYASPGLRNTQVIHEGKEEFRLLSKRIKESITIDYSGVEPGFLEINLYSLHGSLIEVLGNNLWLGSEGQVKVERTYMGYSGQAILNLVVTNETGKRKILNLACYLN